MYLYLPFSNPNNFRVWLYVGFIYNDKFNYVRCTQQEYLKRRFGLFNLQLTLERYYFVRKNISKVKFHNHVVLPSFMAYHRIFNRRSTRDGAIWAGTAYHLEAHEFTPPRFFVTQSLDFCVVFCWSLFLFVLFLLAIVLSVLQIMASDYSLVYRYSNFSSKYSIHSIIKRVCSWTKVNIYIRGQCLSVFPKI